MHTVNRQKDNHRVKLLGYVFIPITFLLVGIAFLYITLSPVVQSVLSTVSFITSDVASDFNSNIIDKFSGSTLKHGTVDNADVDIPYVNEKYGHLVCERLGVDASVYWGDNNNCLYAGIGTYPSSMIPGYGYPTLLSAHNTTYFKPLKDVKIGDEFKFTTNYGVYTYKVVEKKVAKYSTFKWETLAEKNDQLILYTCYPFEKMAGVKKNRLFVYCNKVSGPEIVNMYTD